MPVSIKEIAKATGFSTQTVSRILNNNGKGHKQDTCEKVMKVAEEMGYRPNSLARAMVLGKFGGVGLLLSTNSGKSYLPESLLSSIHDQLAERDLHLTIGRLPDSKLTDSDYLPKIMREWSCDGLLINYTDHAPEEMMDLIEKSRLPSVWINAKLSKNCVYPDDFGAGRLATEYLIRQGHRRIAYQNYRWGARMEEAHYSVIDRIEGYKAAMTDAGLEPMVLQEEHKLNAPQRYEKTKAWLALDQAPTAVICYTNPEVIYAAGLEIGLNRADIPAIVSFSDQPVVFAGQPMLTAHLDRADVGKAAVERLLHKLDHGNPDLAPVTIPYRMYLGHEQLFV